MDRQVYRRLYTGHPTNQSPDLRACHVLKLGSHMMAQGITYFMGQRLVYDEGQELEWQLLIWISLHRPFGLLTI